MGQASSGSSKGKGRWRGEPVSGATGLAPCPPKTIGLPTMVFWNLLWHTRAETVSSIGVASRGWRGVRADSRVYLGWNLDHYDSSWLDLPARDVVETAATAAEWPKPIKLYFWAAKQFLSDVYLQKASKRYIVKKLKG